MNPLVRSPSASSRVVQVEDHQTAEMNVNVSDLRRGEESFGGTPSQNNHRWLWKDRVTMVGSYMARLKHRETIRLSRRTEDLRFPRCGWVDNLTSVSISFPGHLSTLG